MSIPDRLWTVVRGYWSLAEDRLEEAEAQASAYAELADHLRPPSPPPGPPADDPAAAAELSPRTGPAAQRQPALTSGFDPLQASYELLGARPGLSIPELEQVYEARVAAIRPEQYPSGSSERAALEAKRSAVQAAYEHLRDILNPTETRFERLEF